MINVILVAQFVFLLFSIVFGLAKRELKDAEARGAACSAHNGSSFYFEVA